MEFHINDGSRYPGAYAANERKERHSRYLDEGISSRHLTSAAPDWDIGAAQDQMGGPRSALQHITTCSGGVLDDHQSSREKGEEMIFCPPLRGWVLTLYTF